MSMLRDAWIDWRNRLLADPRCQQFLLRMPLTRPIALRRARALFDLVAGFSYSQLLLAGVETGLFDRLHAEGPLPAGAIAGRIGLPPEGTQRLLDGLAALGLIERTRAGFALGRHGAALAGTPGLQAMIRHQRLLYAELAEPAALLKGDGRGLLADFWPYAAGGDGGADGYTSLMAATLPMVADALLEAYPFGRHRAVLDVGGGEGVFLERLGERHPAPARLLFDLPAVVERAHCRIGEGATLVAGDFRRDPLPEGADCITLIRILHDHDDGPAESLLGRAFAALPPGGALVIAEPMAGVPGLEPIGAAYFSLYLAAMGSGRPRTPAGICRLVRNAGFRRVRRLRSPNPLATQIVSARVPA
jgi:demethylspheroidene O-methyltransferase